MKSVHRLLKPSKHSPLIDAWKLRTLLNAKEDAKFLNPIIRIDYSPPTKHQPLKEKLENLKPRKSRGIDTITIPLKGGFHHKDKHGHSSTITPGMVQWLRAGKGTEHQESLAEELLKKGGTSEMIQLWLNLPKEHKNVEPSLETLVADKIPKMEVENGTIDLIAGKYNGAVGPGKPLTPLNLLKVELTGPTTLNMPEGWVTGVLVYEGSAGVNGENVSQGECVLLDSKGSDVTIEPETTTKALVLSAEPLDEAFESEGAIVMNSEKELAEALKELNDSSYNQVI